MSAKIPTAAIGDSGMAKSTTAAAAPAAPRQMVTRPTPLPNADVWTMATTRRTSPIGAMTSPTMSSESMMLWLYCHASTRVARFSGVAPGAW